MKLFDSHCHLNDEDYEDDVMEVIERSIKAGVERIMVAGIDRETSIRGLKLAEEVEGVYASVGVHPHDAEGCSDDVLNSLSNLTKNEKIKAWGEIGLDFHYMHSPRSVQETWMEKQLERANELGLPVIFHERESRGRFLEILNACMNGNGQKGVVHCFSGTKKEMFAYLDMGLYIGITGIFTMKKRGSHIRELARHIPEDKILIETDAPYLTPKPQNKNYKRNEPAFVKSVLLKIAEVLHKDPEELSKKIFENTCRLYNVGNNGN